MKKLQKRPDFFLYLVASIYFFIHNKIRYGLKCYGDKIKGPALILSNHASNHDYEFIVSAAMGHRVSFMCTYHWFTFKKLNFWLKRIGAIPKLQFTTDIESVKKVRFIVQHEKGIVFIAPEGTVYANGKLGYIHPSIAKMVRFLNVPVYAVRIEGAGLGNAKWSKYSHKGKVSCTTKLIVNKDETKMLDQEEILKRLTDHIQYNEFDYQKKNNIKINSNNLADGFDTMFYTCPECGSEFSLSSEGNKIECSHCKTIATMTNEMRFVWSTEKQHYDNYIQWYDAQYEKVLEEVSDPAFEYSEEVDYGTHIEGQDNYVKVGHGIITVNHQGWTYKGTFQGNEVEEHDEIKQVPLATLKAGLHFELPYKAGHCRVFYPKNGNTSMKWHLISRALTQLSD